MSSPPSTSSSSLSDPAPVTVSTLTGTPLAHLLPEDLTRRSNSPVAPSSGTTPNSPGSATVSGVGSPVRVNAPLPSPLRRAAISAPGAPIEGDAQGEESKAEEGSAGATSGGSTAVVAKDGPAGAPPTDSISLGQLKAITQGFNKPKASVYTFPSPVPDTSDLLSELEEFYSYVEVSGVIEYKEAFLQSWPHQTDFANTPEEKQLAHIKKLLDGLADFDPDVRFNYARQLLYVAQGTFQSSTSPEHHMHLIMSNVALLRKANALTAIWEAVKGTNLRWEGVSGLPEHEGPPSPGGYTAQEKHEVLEEVNGELALLLAVLYFMMEVNRGEELWGEELMQLEPPMPIYLFNLVAGLRERNAKGYPVKKLLLLLWKSILACIGGMKDVARVKEFVREVESLPPDDKTKQGVPRPETKAAPVDFQSFRNEITAKYPSYAPPPIALAPNVDRIAAASAPTPVKQTFSYHINPNHQVSGPVPGGMPPPGSQAPIPGTPAPSPPPSPAPKPKKLQFQTDQSKPFVLPFAPANAGPKGRQPRAVPASIEEAGELYRRNMRISTELWQTWKLREEYMAEESGLLKAARLEGDDSRTNNGSANGGSDKGKGKRGTTTRDDLNRLSHRMEQLAVASDSGDDKEEESEEEEDPMDPLAMLRKLERSIKKEEDEEQDDKKKKKLHERRVDVQRLERVEQLYRSTLPQLQSAVIVLLKLLLATVTASTNNNLNNNNAGGGGANDSGNGQQQRPPRGRPPVDADSADLQRWLFDDADEPVELNLEDTDIMRHREITSKAVSAILILALKWFKTSHVMKFHYLSQLLVDSNCLLLILKMFGLQEVSTSVKTKNDRPDHNFFKFCNDHVNPSDSDRPEDALTAKSTVSASSSTEAARGGGGGSDSEETELITDFSWRNFFSIINFVHILQKLTKRKTHRVLLLVQYKSSAILKRILKVSHPTLQLYVLKVIKSQVPYCGRKWRQSNMKVITAIYLHCRPDLRDEWLTGLDVDAEVEESLPHEQALRTLVKFFNTKHYANFAPHLHRRNSNVGNGNHPPPEFGQVPAPASPSSRPVSDNDVFPPSRSVTSFEPDSSPARSPSFSPEDDPLGDFEIDELLGGGAIGADGEEWADLDHSTRAQLAWDQLGDILGNLDEDISDSESVGSYGLMGFRAGAGGGGYGADGSEDGSVSDLDMHEEAERGRGEWEQINPEAISALQEERASTGGPLSPRPNRRRSSTGPVSPALRPVMIERDEDGDRGSTAIVDEVEDGPAPTEPHSGPAVDEFEAIFGL